MSNGTLSRPTVLAALPRSALRARGNQRRLCHAQVSALTGGAANVVGLQTVG